MGNCCNKCLEWVYPNPWEGMIIENKFAHQYVIQSVRSIERVPAPAPLPAQQPEQEKEPYINEPLIKKHITTPKSSPLHLGQSAVPPPPPLALLEIAKHKKLHIEY